MIIKVNYKFTVAVLLILSVFIFWGAAAQPTMSKISSEKVTENEVLLPVIMYHHLSKKPSRLGDYVVSPEQFEQDLIYIEKNNYHTISSKELLDFLEKGSPLPEKPIMITFDDGYESVHEYAYPLLKKYNCNAIFSPIGKHTDIYSNENEPRNINYSHASWQQICEMQESGLVEIGNHSYDMHDNCANKRYGIRIKKGESFENYKLALQKDIGGFQEEIHEKTGILTTIFAYPFGGQCKESHPILQDLGFKIILTCEEKVNKISPNQTEPIYLKRFNRASHYSTYSFFQKLQ